MEKYVLLCGGCKEHVWGGGFSLNHTVFKQMMTMIGPDKCQTIQDIHNPNKHPVMGQCPVCKKIYGNIPIHIMTEGAYEAKKKQKMYQEPSEGVKVFNMKDMLAAAQQQGGKIHDGSSQGVTGDGPDGEKAGVPE